MRVLFLAEAGSSHTRKWIKGLKSREIEVNLFSLTPVTDRFYDILGVEVTALNYTSLTGRIMHKMLYFKSLPTIRKLVSTFSPDVVHAHYASSYGLLGALSVKVVYCVSVWGSDVYAYPKSGVLYEKLLRYTLSRTNAVFSTSQDMARETALYTDREINVIPFGIDMTVFPNDSAKWKDPQTIRLATAKSLRPIYNIDLVISAFVALRKERPSLKIELHVAGAGPEELECRRAAAGELDKSIFLHGQLTPESMPDFFRDKHILVNVPLTESFGVSILEASASVMAIIASRAGGIPEVVKDKTTGLLLDSIDQNSILEAMRHAVTDLENTALMAKAGREFVSENYNFERCLDLQIEQYEVLNGG